eukprot:CAMPEP_0168314028 /NCGR_PEP_ID=MMETSP0210-20121227/5894_1 /TAXON_ID=40633 /ORGANISM="Condylostoma magnum, Strain COL2" /LENGTH=37 /DNA_ID= /DNA_START= /DNA_END= /DNA_ORIENTATION=
MENIMEEYQEEDIGELEPEDHPVFDRNVLDSVMNDFI